MRHILVVANQTLAAQPLLTALQERLENEPADVFVVVPMTRPKDDLSFREGLVPSGQQRPDTGRDGYEVARRRLAQGLGMIRDLGCEVRGEVGDEDPMDAVDQVMASHQFDEVIVSTLPTGVSRWLRADLPSRVHRKHHVPVTTVTPQEAHSR